MNTFHISPKSSLAADAAAEVRTFSPETLIAIRGEEIEGCGEILYTVSACPDQDEPWRYAWEYVRAGEWLAAYDQNRLAKR